MGRSAARYGRKQLSLSCTFSRLVHAVNREHSEGRLNLRVLLMVEYPSLLAVVQEVALLNQNLFRTTCFPVCFPHCCWKCVRLSQWVCCRPCTFLSRLTSEVLYGDKNHSYSPSVICLQPRIQLLGNEEKALYLFHLLCISECLALCDVTWGPARKVTTCPALFLLQQSNSFSRKLFFLAFLSGGSQRRAKFAFTLSIFE